MASWQVCWIGRMTLLLPEISWTWYSIQISTVSQICYSENSYAVLLSYICLQKLRGGGECEIAQWHFTCSVYMQVHVRARTHTHTSLLEMNSIACVILKVSPNHWDWKVSVSEAALLFTGTTCPSISEVWLSITWYLEASCDKSVDCTSHRPTTCTQAPSTFPANVVSTGRHPWPLPFPNQVC